MEYIYIIPKALSKEICDEIIEKFDKQKNTEINEPGFEHMEYKIEQSDEKWKNIDNILFQNLNQYIQKYIGAYIFGTKVIENLVNNNVKDTGFKIFKFNKDEGRLDYHLESFFINEKGERFVNGNQIIKYTWYLNDVDEGGESEFWNNYSIKPETGKLVMFPATWTYPNSELIPKSNNKYIINGFILIN